MANAINPVTYFLLREDYFPRTLTLKGEGKALTDLRFCHHTFMTATWYKPQQGAAPGPLRRRGLSLALSGGVQGIPYLFHQVHGPEGLGNEVLR